MPMFDGRPAPSRKDKHRAAIGLVVGLGLLGSAVVYSATRPGSHPLTDELKKTGTVAVGQAYDGDKLPPIAKGYRIATMRSDGTSLWSAYASDGSIWSLASPALPAVATKSGDIVGLIFAYKEPRAIVACDVTPGVTKAKAETETWQFLPSSAKYRADTTVAMVWSGAKTACLYRATT